ncbi:Uncharacterised protein [Serratia fonticola]|nr:Uncharacterised protein [Serratia fonticola]
MSQQLNPLLDPERAAHEVVLELARAGKLANARQAAEAFTLLLDHFVEEMQQTQSKVQ